MIDLFQDDEIMVQREASDYVVTGASGVVARARFRSPEMKHELRHLLRSLLSRFNTPRTEFDVSDAAGVSRFEIVSDAGNRTDLHLTVTDAGGTVVGTASSTGGSFTVSPTISLADAAGTAVGHLTTMGAPRAFDAADREIASVTLGTTKPAFGKLRYELRFLGDVPQRSRALIVAGLIGWDHAR